jgi:hypothetical protein
MRVKTEQRISNIRVLHFYPRWYVRTTRRDAGLGFALFLFLFLRTNYSIKILHYCPISPCFQHITPYALPGSLARQPCPAALPGSLARQPCPACSITCFYRPKAVNLVQAFPAICVQIDTWTWIRTEVIFSLVIVHFLECSNGLKSITRSWGVWILWILFFNKLVLDAPKNTVIAHTIKLQNCIK